MFKKNMKKLDLTDIALTKLTVLAGTMFLISILPSFANWVTSTHWGWFLGAAILLGIRPTYRFYFK